MSHISLPARLAGAAGVCLTLLASPATAQSCVGYADGPHCGYSTSMMQSTITVGGSGTTSQVFVTVLGADAYNALQLVFMPTGMTPYALSDVKPRGTMGWTPTGGATVQLPGLFAPGTELALGVTVNGSQTLQSGTGSSSNPGGEMHFREFAEGESVYGDDRTTVMATGSAGSQLYGFEDVRNGDGDYNDLVFQVESVTVTPEPGTLLLVGGGLVGLAGVTVRRRRRALATH